MVEICQDTKFIESNALLTLNLAYGTRSGDVVAAERVVLAYLMEHSLPGELDTLETATSVLRRLCAEAKFQMATRPKED